MADYAEEQIRISADQAQYDTYAKTILADKEVLAWILRDTVSECKNMTLEEIQNCLGQPEIGSVSIKPGMTTQAVTGLSNESKVPNEGNVFFDVLVAVMIPGQEKIGLIVNIEAQRTYNPGYSLVKRALFYASRLISSQLSKEFEIPHYDDLKKVYSVWICFNSPEKVLNGPERYYIVGETADGTLLKDEDADILDVVFVCLSKKERKNITRLQQMLFTLFSPELTPDAKIKTLHEKFQFSESTNRKEAFNSMCNLSQDLVDKGAQKKTEEIIRHMLKNGLPIDTIRMSIPDLSDEDLMAIIEKAKNEM